MTFRVVVCGGRAYSDRERVFKALDAAHAKRPFSALLHGGAPGADALASEWANARGVPVEVYPADWKAFGRGAGPIRNGQMAKAADAVIAFPGGTGTADMIRRAKAAELPLWRPYG